MKICVENLKRPVDVQSIRKLFEPFGRVSSVKVTGNTTAEVDMPDIMQAYAAIRHLDQWRAEGGVLSVSRKRNKTFSKIKTNCLGIIRLL